MFGEGRAIGQVQLPVGADVGRSVLPFSDSQQGSTIVDKWLPAVLSEVNNVLRGVFLQVAEPAQTRTDFKKSQVKKKTVCNPVCCTQHLHCFLVWFEQFAGELTEDGQVGEVRWRGCFWGLTKPLEHKLYAVPARMNPQTTRTLGTKTCKKRMRVTRNTSPP